MAEETKVITVTAEGLKKLQDDLAYLVNVKRPEVTKNIGIARGFGDLSENSEYDEAKAEQGQIHARIAELDEMIRNARVLAESEIDKSRVSVGSIVRVFNETRGVEVEYHIVGSYETDPVNGKISDSSPVGIALLGAKEGNEVVVAGAREQHLKVLKVTRAKEA